MRKETENAIEMMAATTSADMQSMLAVARVAARTKIPAMVIGETGTGKEVLASAMHKWSNRADAPFVAVNCAAVPQDLFESTFFGHTKGAFTGALVDQPGLFREADGGTLFLDEVTEMSPFAQAKLLRVLQEERVRPLGSRGDVPFDTRVIASSNRDMRQAVEDGTLRSDLYYRLKGVELTVPPLRERRADIPVLAQHFMAVAHTVHGLPPVGINMTAVNHLCAHSWPGNVRELQGTVMGAVLRAASQGRGHILSHDLDIIGRDQKAGAMLQQFEDASSVLPAALPPLVGQHYPVETDKLALQTIAGQMIFDKARQAVQDEKRLYAFSMTHLARAREKLSLEEIGQVIGCKTNTVAEYVADAKGTVRDKLVAEKSPLAQHPMFDKRKHQKPEERQQNMSFFNEVTVPDACRIDLAHADLLLRTTPYHLYGWSLTLPHRGIEAAYRDDPLVAKVTNYSAMVRALAEAQEDINRCKAVEGEVMLRATPAALPRLVGGANAPQQMIGS